MRVRVSRVVLFGCVVAVVVFVLAVVFSFIHHGRFEYGGNKFLCRMTEYNVVENSSYSSIVSLSKPIEGSMKSFHGSSGNLIVLSRPDEQQGEFESDYRCKGSCFCKGDVARRVAVVLGRGLIFVMTTVSFVAATQISKMYFNDLCNAQFSDDCDDIFAEVEECDLSNSDLVNTQQSREEDSIQEYGEIDDFDIYKCRGYCMMNKKLRRVNTIEEAVNFDCESQWIEERVKASRSKFTSKFRNGYAKLVFLNDYMVSFCSGISQFSYPDPYPGSRSPVRVQLCVATCKGMKNVYCYKESTVSSITKKFQGDGYR